MRHRLFAFGLVAVLFLAAGLLGRTPRAEAQVPAVNRTVTLVAAQKTVAAAATPEVLGSGYADQVVITPLDANTSTFVEVRSAQGTAGFELRDGSSIVIPLQGDLSSIWIDVGTNGDGVSYMTWRD